jgi:undecaprenyl-diphosphatase
MPAQAIVDTKRQLTTLLVASIALFVLALFAFCFTGYVATHYSPLAFDAAIVAWLHSISGPAMTRCVTTITFFGSGYFLIPCYIVLVIYYLFIHKRPWFAVAIACLGFFGNRLLFLVQDVFARVRPADPLITNVFGYGYPSGHSFASFMFAGLLAFLVWQQPWQLKRKLVLVIFFFCVASTIALTRPYLHVHYPTDVLGGLYLAIIWLIPFWWILYFAYNRDTSNKSLTGKITVLL